MNYLLKDKDVVIKKERICWGCGLPQEPKSTMRYMVVVNDSYFTTSHWCEICSAFLKENEDNFKDGVCFEEFKGESEYNDFKKKYFSSTRNVLFEKHDFLAAIKKGFNF